MIAAETVILWIILTGCAWLGARRAGRGYGASLGGLCLAFWIVLSGMPLNNTVSGLQVILFTAAAAGMMSAGILAGKSPPGPPAEAACSAEAPSEVYVRYDTQRRLQRLQRLCDLPNEFGEWLEQYRQHHDPWPAFDSHIRGVLARTCGASEIRTFRVMDDSDLLLPLGDVGPQQMADYLRAAEGIVHWVAAEAQPYYGFAGEADAQLQEVLARTPQRFDWCFPVIRSRQVVGVVAVGTLDRPQRNGVFQLRLVAGLISEQWGCVAEICRARVAEVTDPPSGLLARGQFLRQAPLVLERSQREARPVTAAVFAIEGLQRLDALGFWGLHDNAVASVGRVLRQRLSPQDCASRFDDSRFMVLWDGRDPGHSAREAREIRKHLQTLFDDRQRWGEPLRVRCGTATFGHGCRNLQSLITTALTRTERTAELDDAAEPQEAAAVVSAAGGGGPGGWS